MELKDFCLTDECRFISTQCSGGMAVSEASVCFSVSQTDSFSAQVDSILRGDFLPLGAPGPRRLCLVCGDRAFRVPLRRRILENTHQLQQDSDQSNRNPLIGNIEYSCPVASKCEITKRRRKACQACRFQKCLQAGMMREGVRMDRVRGGRQKYKRPTESGVTFYCKTPISPPASCREFKQHGVHLTRPPVRHKDESTNESSLSTVLTLCDLLNRQLLLLIGWAKQIPGFAALSLVDQMLLLQSGWMEALLVGVAWRSQGEELVFAENLRLDEAQCRAAGLADLYEALRHLSTKYQAMNLSPEEAVMLKALALANTGTHTHTYTNTHTHTHTHNHNI
ncbi:Estrogen-related receptor gamma [Dissostichus eleginoides]|uniref:Estrogen-related receptor gamma n=1 Tax=Dissostichus eleginoides TaxID=100907 RepID=A0AAD9FG13_DISEL|nr:Estrogen-related receptor gamma [Dissostichus eleginoides]